MDFSIARYGVTQHKTNSDDDPPITHHVLYVLQLATCGRFRRT